MTYKMFVCGIMVVCLPFWAVAEEPSRLLDGVSIDGILKAKNTWLRIGVKGSIHFKAGQFFWVTGKKDSDIQAGPYHLQQSGNQLMFTARVAVAKDSQDHVDWQGLYDGHSVSEVKAIWTRVEKDFIHDLVLPDQVTFQFKPQKAN